MTKARQRTCSECPNSIAHKRVGTKTCSDICRKRRSLRLAKQKKTAPRNVDAATPLRRDAHEDEIQSVTREVMKEEIRPIVREAITEDIFKSIADMVRLTPAAIQVLDEHLHSDDETLRHKAASLVTRYTLGHPALVGPQDAEGKQLTVHFNLPRPDAEDVPEATAIEIAERTCDVCGRTAPEDEFVSNSDRCLTCFEQAHEKVLARFEIEA